MRFFRFLVLLLFVCGCSGKSKDVLRVGIDTKWYPLDFGPQTAYVNGFVEELLLELNRYSGMEFQIIYANWDSLFDGMKEKKYEAVFSSVFPYEYNKSKFDFSQNILNLGPVLVVRSDSPKESLSEMKDELIGVITNDPSESLVAKYPTIIIRRYPAIADLLNAVANEEIEAAVLNRIPAVNFVEDLYSSSLKIVGESMTEEGIRLVSMKGHAEAFNRHLKAFKKRKAYEQLLKKWYL